MTNWLVPPGQKGKGIGQQATEIAAGKLATKALGTALSGGNPLVGEVAGQVAGPLASQLVGSFFKDGGAVYKQGGGLTPEILEYITALQSARKKGMKSEDIKIPGRTVDKTAAGPIGAKLFGGSEDAAQPIVQAPRSKAGAEWNIPLGEALGADWSTSGHYSDMDTGKDPFAAHLKGVWKFEKGGDVPGKKTIWDKVKDAASHVWKNKNLHRGPDDFWTKVGTQTIKKPQYKAIGGMTTGPLGMSDMLMAGKDKNISSVKMKKSKGDMSEEVQYDYHAPLAPKENKGE